MTPRRLPHYLRSYRKAAGLSQVEMAGLLGCTTESKISRYERYARRPTLKAQLAYEAVFGVPATELCPGLFAAVQEDVAKRAEALALKLKAAPQDRATARKIELLKRIASKVENSSRTV